MVDIELVKKRFEENKCEMFEFACDIMKQSEKQPVFMQRWVQLCKDKTATVKGAGPDSLKLVFDQIGYLIDKQLDISENMKYAIFYFINKVSSI